MAGIFISLTSEDGPLADALRAALGELLGESVEVSYSTSRELGRAPKSGADWFKWIVDQVKSCDFAFVLLTPQSIQKPWILWEAGAVYSAAVASGGAQDKIRPLLFQVREQQLPSPFRDTTIQYQFGDDREQVAKVFREILEDYIRRPNSPISPAQRRKSDSEEAFNATIDSYLTSVREILLRAASVPTEVAIQEWLERLDALIQQNRRSEVAHLQDWMEIAFGKKSGEEARPIDLRLHTRLADAYLKSREYERALQQLQLGRQLAPRDIYILRTLGRALLDAKRPDDAGQVIDRIAELDASSFERNVECAALVARWYRTKGESKSACDVLRRALSNNPTSYYLANLLGETRLELHDVDGARDAFTQALAIITASREDNIWVNATAANSAFVLGDDTRAIEYVNKIVARHPDEDALHTIERGLRTVASSVGGESRLDALLDVLRPERVQVKKAYLNVSA